MHVGFIHGFRLYEQVAESLSAQTIPPTLETGM